MPFDITFVGLLDIIGTIAFAISGIRLASAKRFDLFGAYIAGLATAIGGGTLRDLMIDVPIFWIQNPLYLICTALSLIYVMIFGRFIIKQNHTWFLFDTIGLGMFTVTGIEKTLNAPQEFPFWAAIIMGTMTGAAGGIIRDVLINEEPLIFRKEFYAMACALGGVCYYIAYSFGLGNVTSGIICGSVVILLRLLAAKYKLQLPVLKGEADEEEKKDK